MADIRSRATLEQIIRKGILTLMVVGFAASFAYDGCVRYPRKNVQKAKEALIHPVPNEAVPINNAVNPENTGFVTEKMRMGEVKERLGEPGWKTTSGSEVSYFYFGPAYSLKLTTIADVILSVDRVESKFKSSFDLQVQKILFVVLTIIALPLLYHYARVLTYTAHLTDQGLKLSGKPFVPFNAMVSWDTTDYKKKGWINIGYELKNEEGTFRLDDYWIKSFRPIVNEICARKGFDNPLDDRKGAEAEGSDTASHTGTSAQSADDPPADA